METSYCKFGDEYEVKLCVRKIKIEYAEDPYYPFCCEIATQDDKFFSCAVNSSDIAQFMLAQENDVLALKLEVVYIQSSVMGVVGCKNITHLWEDTGAQERLNNKSFYFDAQFKVQQMRCIPLPNHATFCSIYLYYCILTQNSNQYVAFFLDHTFVPQILGIKEGDEVSVQVGDKNDSEMYDVLQSFENKSRMIETINQAILEL